jgi:hypothetical protein
MRKRTLSIGLISAAVILTLSVTFMEAQQENSEKAAIKNVVQTAYIAGIQNYGNIEDIRKGFHPGFNLLMKRGETMNKRPIEEWIKIIESGKQKNPDGPAQKTTGKFVSIDITGGSAVVKLELYKNSQQIFTDYLFLYKFGKDWKIVSKIYHRH